MTTRAYGNVKALCVGIEHLFDSAVCSGIVGDSRHRKRGGYHLSREDNPPNNYSVVRPEDRQGPSDAAAGFDISMNRQDMVVATRRLTVAWANGKDPRRKYLNAFNGWTGTGDAQRFDMLARTASRATPDHKWHLHGEIRRAYVPSPAMVKAVLSALRGEPVAQYLVSVGVRPFAPTVAAPVPPYPGRVLRRTTSNRTDMAVKMWQQRMIGRGWKTIGKADGLFGAKTENVVRRFQRKCKVTDDGVIGPATWPLPWTRPLG